MFHRCTCLADDKFPLVWNKDKLGLVGMMENKLLQSFIDVDIWDEVRTLTNESLFVNEGLPVPELIKAVQISEEKYNNDLIQYFKHE